MDHKIKKIYQFVLKTILPYSFTTVADIVVSLVTVPQTSCWSHRNGSVTTITKTENIPRSEPWDWHQWWWISAGRWRPGGHPLVRRLRCSPGRPRVLGSWPAPRRQRGLSRPGASCARVLLRVATPVLPNAASPHTPSPWRRRTSRDNPRERSSTLARGLVLHRLPWSAINTEGSDIFIIIITCMYIVGSRRYTG